MYDTNPLIIIVFLLFLVIIIDVIKNATERANSKVIYRYVPRSFMDEQEDPIPLKFLVGDMFDRQSPWKASFNIYEKPKLINIGDKVLVVPSN